MIFRKIALGLVHTAGVEGRKGQNGVTWYEDCNCPGETGLNRSWDPGRGSGGKSGPRNIRKEG